MPTKEEWAATAPVRNPGERAALCALAHLAHRESGLVQERRLRLAGAATMGVATFRRHVAALAEPSRGIIAISHPITACGDHDETIYTLVGWLRLRGVAEPDSAREIEHLSGEASQSATQWRAPSKAAPRAFALASPKSTEIAVGAFGDARAKREVCFAPTDARSWRDAPSGRIKSDVGAAEIVPQSDRIEQRAEGAHKDESLGFWEESPRPWLSSAGIEAPGGARSDRAPSACLAEAEDSFRRKRGAQLAEAQCAGVGSRFENGPPAPALGGCPEVARSGEGASTDDGVVLMRWFRTLVGVAGPGLCDPAKESRLHTTSGELVAWRNAGVDLELDAVPIVRARTAKPRVRPIWSWGALREDVLAAAARRKARLKLPEIDHAPIRGVGGVSSARLSAAEREAADAEARRRSLARVLDEFESRSARPPAPLADEADFIGSSARARSAG